MRGESRPPSWLGLAHPENFLADVSSPGLVVRGLGRGRIEEAVPRQPEGSDDMTT